MIDNIEIKKGDIYYASLNPIIGSEQNGTRPVVVVQNNFGNKYSPTLIVAPITSKVDSKPNLSTHVIIKAFGNITHDSIVLLEQVRVIDKSRLKSFLGRLNYNKIIEINEALLNAFGIRKSLKKDDENDENI